MKIEQRKVRGPQVEQTALLASPIYIGQAQGEGKKTHIKRGAKVRAVSLSPACWRTPLLSFLRLFGSACPHALRMDSLAIF